MCYAVRNAANRANRLGAVALEAAGEGGSRARAGSPNQDVQRNLVVQFLISFSALVSQQRLPASAAQFPAVIGLAAEADQADTGVTAVL